MMTTGLKNSFQPSPVQYGFLKHPCLPLSSCSSDITYKGQILFKGRNIKSLYSLILPIFSFWLFRTTVSSLASLLRWPIMPPSQMGPWLPSTMNSSCILEIDPQVIWNNTPQVLAASSWPKSMHFHLTLCTLLGEFDSFIQVTPR